MSGSWFREEPALVEALHEQAEGWPHERGAWEASSDEDLLLGIVARHCSRAEERRALLDTVVTIVETMLQHVPVSGSQLLEALRVEDDDARLTIHMGAAFARACAAVLEARRLLASLDRLEARGLVEQASSAWSRAVTQMLDALRAAQGAFGHLSERDGGVRARSATPAAIVRRRHPGPHH